MSFSSRPLKSFLINIAAFASLVGLVLGLLALEKDGRLGWIVVIISSIVLCVSLILILLGVHKEKKPDSSPALPDETPPPSVLETAVWNADETGTAPIAELLAAGQGQVNDSVSEGRSLLAYAVDIAPADVVQFLLESGADPNASGAGELPAVSAVLSEDCLSLAWLLAFGADPLRVDGDGDSAFSLALEADQDAEMRVLILLQLDPAARAQCLLKVKELDAGLERRVLSGLALRARMGGEGSLFR